MDAIPRGVIANIPKAVYVNPAGRAKHVISVFENLVAKTESALIRGSVIVYLGGLENFAMQQETPTVIGAHGVNGLTVNRSLVKRNALGRD